MHSLGEYKRFKFPYVNMRRYNVYTNAKIPSGGNNAENRVHLLSDKDGSFQCVGISRIIDTLNSEDLAKKIVDSMLVFSSDSREECENFISWLNCKFTRFFVAINISKLTGILTDDYFRFVPAPPSGKFDHIYTDEELYQAFNLPQKYIDVIETVIKERK